MAEFRLIKCDICSHGIEVKRGNGRPDVWITISALKLSDVCPECVFKLETCMKGIERASKNQSN